MICQSSHQLPKALVLAFVLAASVGIKAQPSSTWHKTGSMNTARYYHSAILLTNGQVLVTGGGGGSNPELYNPSTGMWTVTGSMTTARDHHTATLLQNGQVLVAGGVTIVNGSYVTLSSAELYNPSTGT